MNKFIPFFLLFMIYSFLGWCMEVILHWFQTGKIVNRGFLIGPYCPIYGYGVIGILFLIGENSKDVLDVFLKSILICSILEYFTSYFMEKVFHARWWDYSQKKFNINGRICLETMIPFGILGTFCFYILNPLLLKFIFFITPPIRIVLFWILLVVYVGDNMISFYVMNKIKKNIKGQKRDNTEKIRKNVLKWLEKNSFLYRHISHAYPNFKIERKKRDKWSWFTKKKKRKKEI